MATRGALGCLLAALVLLAGCGGGGGEPVAAPPPAAPSAAEGRFLEQVARANEAEATAFPEAGGRTLQELANLTEPGPQVALASSVFTPGANRFAFGVIGADNALVFAPTAVYVGRNAGAPAAGPFPARLDPLLVDAPYRSQASASTADIFSAIYGTELRLPGAGTYEVLVVSQDGGRLIGAPTIIRATPGTAIPAVGERPPPVSTETLASAGGDVASIDTREPTSGMHEVDLADTLGRRPVALIFATPALCRSRVCGPVVDVAVQLREEYGDRVEFIHQEVFVDNRLERGFRPPLEAYSLPSEPWLFTFDAEGRVAARLEGSFGLGEFRAAIEAAL